MPIHLHCIGLNLGSVDGLDPDYVDRVARLADRLDVVTVSDHFAWRSIDGRWSMGFLPIPLVPEVVGHVASRVRAVEERLGRRITLETPVDYVALQPEGVDVAEWGS